MILITVSIVSTLLIIYYMNILVALLTDEYAGEHKLFLNDMRPFKLWYRVIVEKIKDMDDSN